MSFIQSSFDSYDAYINGLARRNTKPWTMSSNLGVTIKDQNYTWAQIEKDVSALKTSKVNQSRMFFKTDLTWDEQVWQSFNCLADQLDIWNQESAKDTYGIETADGVQASWEQFRFHVEQGFFMYTDERNAITEVIFEPYRPTHAEQERQAVEVIDGLDLSHSIETDEQTDEKKDEQTDEKKEFETDEQTDEPDYYTDLTT